MSVNQLPVNFLERLKLILSPENYQRYLLSISEKKFTSFRVNTLKTSDAAALSLLEAQGFDIKKIEWCQNAYYIPHKQRRELTNSQLMQQGMIYIQNPSSLFASLVLNPVASEEVLDMAAAPGGKTLHIAQLMNNEGRIAAVEAVRQRFFRLRANVELAGATMVNVYCKDSTRLGRIVPERFDRVLLDAPCSSEARFNIEDPKSFAFWSEKKVQEMQRKQKKLIYSAIQCLKPTGILVYCTCSFAPEENEAIIQYALDKFGAKISVLPIEVPFDNYQKGLSHWKDQQFDANLTKSVRIIPNDKMSGFYVCKIIKL